MRLSEFTRAMETIAPIKFAEPWDNVGLLVGDPVAEVKRALLAIDYTPAVADEAKSKSCDLVISYHPPIFEAIKRVTANGSTELVFDAVRRGVAIYSPHTALDVAEGGTNDVLADFINLYDRGPLKLVEPKVEHYKLVTFVPQEALETVANAVFDAGAGSIGEYSRCSFRNAGTGTFLGSSNTNPTVGNPGQFERVEEVRLETVVPIAKVTQVVHALTKSHPYEEPAFDLQLMAPQTVARGIGRIGKVPDGVTAEMLANLLKRGLEVDHLLVAGPVDQAVRKAAVCAGACGGDMLSAALVQSCDLYITGEMRHHDALRAIRAGCTVICTLHSNSERAVLRKLKQRLEALLPDLTTHLSLADRDPFSIR